VTRSIEITIDAVDAGATASFWERALGYERLSRLFCVCPARTSEVIGDHGPS
jgi:hypothetical protein